MSAFPRPHRRRCGWRVGTFSLSSAQSFDRDPDSASGRRADLDLQEDGTFTAIGTFAGFLGHGRWDFSQKPLANGLALVEFTYEFVSFYERLLREYIEPIPGGVRFAVGVRNAHYEDQLGPRKLLLAAGPLGDWYGYDRGLREAPESAFDGSVDTPVSDGEPRIHVGRVSFDLLRQLFNFFGFTDDAVPYATEQGDAIDFDQITNM